MAWNSKSVAAVIMEGVFFCEFSSGDLYMYYTEETSARLSMRSRCLGIWDLAAGKKDTLEGQRRKEFGRAEEAPWKALRRKWMLAEAGGLRRSAEGPAVPRLRTNGWR